MNIDNLLGRTFSFLAPRGRGFEVRERVTIIGFDPEKGVRIMRTLTKTDRVWIPLEMFKRAYPGWVAE